MKSNDTNLKIKYKIKNKIKLNISKYEKIFLVFVALFILCINNETKIDENHIIEDIINIDNSTCQIIKNKLINRTGPFDFQEEFLFISSLISCKIPFSFIRFGDGEDFIMRGQSIKTDNDNWKWEHKHKKFRESLIQSSSICTYPNSFISLPCENWSNISKSILSFSNCTSSKFMSYATLFINKNYQIFKNWLIHFIKSSNRWNIVLLANSIIKKNISWAYKFFPIPEHLIENWEKYSTFLLPKLSEEVKQNNLIFFISAGPAANIIISYLSKINNKNIYIDVGSSIEFITKGYSTRDYSKRKSKYSKQKCKPFYILNKTLIYN
jgi:hypothetical protein